jgi:outer membrane lipoprotein carrier protein
MRKIVFLFVVAAVALSQTAEEVARNAEATLRSYQTFQAEFKHLYYSTNVSAPLIENGKCYFQKPGLMRWHYEEPEEKIYLLKDRIIESYFPEDNQLLRSSFTEEDDSEILSLLSGRIGLLENYTAEFSPFPTENRGVSQIKLTPKGEQPDTYILLELDEKTWLIKKAVFFDWAGNKSEFHFDRIRKDMTFPKGILELKVPPGTEIIEDIRK